MNEVDEGYGKSKAEMLEVPDAIFNVDKPGKFFDRFGWF